MINTIVETKSIDGISIPHEILNYIPIDSAQYYKMVPLALKDGILEIGMVDPTDIKAVDVLNFINRKSGTPFKIFKIVEKDFESVISMYQGLTGEVGVALKEFEIQLSEEERSIQAEIDKQEKGAKDTIKEDAPVIKIVATILRYAVEDKASDIHIELSDHGVRVRFRVDGLLHTTITLPRQTHRNIVARIKVLSSLRLDERRKPQDGRFSAVIAGRKIDFRVSTFPTYEGEKVVMRILDRGTGVKTFEDLGLSPHYADMVRRAIKRPYGLILISGPTGSGKSTTLYSILSEIDRETKNVLSLEDPIEYYIDGVNQSQVRPEIGYDFANGLRTTLRQDPDIIMVGEIRDAETAKLAIQAALTGHLVISTIHTNNALGIIPRLVDMGVDPYLIAPTLVLGMAQRLVRRLCPNAGTPTPVTPEMRNMFVNEFRKTPSQFTPEIPDEVLSITTGSTDCPSGTRGRVAVFEVFESNSQLERVILHSKDESDFNKVIKQQGMVTMKQDAIIKAFDGIIPVSEIYTVGNALVEDDYDYESSQKEWGDRQSPKETIQKGAENQSELSADTNINIETNTSPIINKKPITHDSSVLDILKNT